MKRIILAISVLFVLVLAGAAIAYQRSNVVQTATMSCCCSGDSCPMKKDAAGKESASCCDSDCCKDGACAMKNSAAHAEGHHSESCPMMKGKDGQASHASMTDADHKAMTADGKSCCCACCAAKKDA
jgi:hypothetical protein